MAEEKKKDTKSEVKKEDKPKRGLDWSIGDHGSWAGSSEGLSGLSYGIGSSGHGDHVETDHIKAVTITKHVAVPKPYPVHVEKHVPYPVKVPVKVPVDRPYPVHVPQPYPVTVEKHIPYTVEKHIPYPVKVPVKYPVKVPYEVKVPVKVPVEVQKHVPYPVKVPVVVKEPYPVYYKEHSHGESGGYGGFEGLGEISWSGYGH